MATPALSLNRYFSPLRDPRRPHRRRHLLLDLIAMTLCAVIAGADDWQQVVTFARRRRDWLATFLALPGGIPSHDTFERVFDRLDPHAFQACFRRWVTALADALGLTHIAIDGKTLRGSGNGPNSWGPLHLVSAWATDCQLSLGQVAVADKSNEITAIPQLLELLDLNGALVTIDAMGCQKEIAKKIVAGGGDYLLAVKDNQPHLLEDVRTCLLAALAGDEGAAPCDSHTTHDRGHGREEMRCCVIVTDPKGIRNREAWAGLKVVGMCRSERTVAGKTSEEVRFFIGSRAMSAQEYAVGLRGHWGIENNLHWQLDITFAEDNNRVQRRHGAENLALLRRLALTLLKQHPDKQSVACKRLAAALDPHFLEEILRYSGKMGTA
jgi:predicted transposase YbfD/YdcC